MQKVEQIPDDDVALPPAPGGVARVRTDDTYNFVEHAGTLKACCDCKLGRRKQRKMCEHLMKVIRLVT